jgi:ParB/RepB/Spo0J family partition protein
MSVQLKPGVVAQVPVGELERDPNQPRKEFDPNYLRELGETMKIKIRHPLIIRMDGKRKIIFDGECRWRAAKLAKLAKVPCLLDDGKEDSIARAAGQLHTSQQRKSLSPLEIAEFLVDLQKREKKSTNELLAALSKAGIQDMGAVKMEAVMRLVELPPWLKNGINEGKFTPAHGAAAVAAIGYPEVLKELQVGVEDRMDWQGSLTAKEFADELSTAFSEVGHDLNAAVGPPKDIRQFAIAVCKKCEFYKKIGKLELCLNRAEFDKKNAEALKLKGGVAGKPATEVKLSPSEKRAQQKEQEQRAEQRQVGRKDRMRDHLDRWLRAALQKHVETFVGADDSLVIWLALGAPNAPAWNGGSFQRHEEAAKITSGLISTWKLATLADVLAFAHKLAHEGPHLNELNKAALRAMTREELRWFARDHLKLQLDHTMIGFKIDADYLHLKRKPEMLEMAKAANVEKIDGGSVSAIKATLLQPEIVERIGIPADIAELYAEEFHVNDDDEMEDPMDDPVCIECGCNHEDACPPGCAWVAIDETPIKIGRGASMESDDGPVGICSACPTKRWDAGERTLSETAIARIKERNAMMHGHDGGDELKDLENTVADQIGTKAAKKKRAKP